MFALKWSCLYMFSLFPWKLIETSNYFTFYSLTKNKSQNNLYNPNLSVDSHVTYIVHCLLTCVESRQWAAVSTCLLDIKTPVQDQLYGSGFSHFILMYICHGYLPSLVVFWPPWYLEFELKYLPHWHSYPTEDVTVATTTTIATAIFSNVSLINDIQM